MPIIGILSRLRLVISANGDGTVRISPPGGVVKVNELLIQKEHYRFPNSDQLQLMVYFKPVESY